MDARVRRLGKSWVSVDRCGIGWWSRTQECGNGMYTARTVLINRSDQLVHCPQASRCHFARDDVSKVADRVRRSLNVVGEAEESLKGSVGEELGLELFTGDAAGKVVIDGCGDKHERDEGRGMKGEGENERV